MLRFSGPLVFFNWLPACSSCDQHGIIPGIMLSSRASLPSAGSAIHFSTSFFSWPCMLAFVSGSTSWIFPTNHHRRTLAPILWTFSTNMAVTISILMAKDTIIVTRPRSGRFVAGRRGAPRVTVLVTTTIEETL